MAYLPWVSKWLELYGKYQQGKLTSEQVMLDFSTYAKEQDEMVQARMAERLEQGKHEVEQAKKELEETIKRLQKNED